MNTMTKDDVVAELALRELRKRERLMEIIHQPGFRYYTGGSLLGATSALAFGTLVAWMFLRENVPGWGFLLFIISAVGCLEATRQRCRFNALLELHELEKNKASKSCEASGDNVSI